MTYELVFHDLALKEWRKLGAPVREQFKNKLAERQHNPHVPAARIRSENARYKIKLRSSGYRLVYEVRDAQVLIMVIAIGKRERAKVHRKAADRSGNGGL